tara:strand:- start:2174 stop:3058 length:885 start_codon:yes stop_codon:yes gene_type:complete
VAPNSAIEKHLIDLGVPNPHAKLLSYDRRLEDVQAMDTETIAKVLGISQEKAEGVHCSIHSIDPSLADISNFQVLLSWLHTHALEHLRNLTNDSMRIDAAALWSKHSGEPSPANFNDLSAHDEDTTTRILHLLHLEFGISAPFASCLRFVIDRTDIVVTGVQFCSDTLPSVATELAELDFIEDKDAEFLGRNSDLISPNMGRELRAGDTVAYWGPKIRSKASKYRPRRCGSRSTNPSKDFPWPASRWNQLGKVIYGYRWENNYDIEFEDGTTIAIHSSHLARVIAVGRNGTWTS